MMGSDQVAVIRPTLVEVEDAVRRDGSEIFAEFKVPGPEVVWVEAAIGVVNFVYPYFDPPDERLRRSGIVELPGLGVEDWKPGVFATFTFDPATSNHDVARFIDKLIEIVLGCGDDYLLDVELHWFKKA